jgi:hypothetical protein
MAEGLLTLSMLFGLVFTFQSLGAWQDTTLRLLANTTHRGFVTSKGESMSQPVIKQNRSRLNNPISVKASSVSAQTDRLTMVSKQLEMKHQHLVVSQSGFFKEVEGSQNFEIKRHSYIDIGEGRSLSDRHVHERISKTDALWRRAGIQSQATARTIGLSTGVVDQPWKRSKLSTDWFSRWESAVPERYLTRGKP